MEHLEYNKKLGKDFKCLFGITHFAFLYKIEEMTQRVQALEETLQKVLIGCSALALEVQNNKEQSKICHM